MKLQKRNPLRVGIISLQEYGFSERSVAIDILASIVKTSGHQLAFVKDASFCSLKEIWDCIRKVSNLDLVAVSLRPGSGSLVPILKDTLNERERKGLNRPHIVLGGHIAQCSPDQLQAILPESLVFSVI